MTKEIHPASKRTLRVTLTSKGRAFRPLFDEISADLLKRLYRGVSRYEQDELMRLLNRIDENL